MLKEKIFFTQGVWCKIFTLPGSWSGFFCIAVLDKKNGRRIDSSATDVGVYEITLWVTLFDVLNFLSENPVLE